MVAVPVEGGLAAVAMAAVAKEEAVLAVVGSDWVATTVAAAAMEVVMVEGAS